MHNKQREGESAGVQLNGGHKGKEGRGEGREGGEGQREAQVQNVGSAGVCCRVGGFVGSFT